MKKCIRCELTKSLEEFKEHGQTGRKRNVCNLCTIKQIRKWTDDNREKVNKNQRNYHETIDGRTFLLHNSARIRAKKKKQLFLLTFEDVKKGLLIGKCAKTGIPFDFNMGFTKKSPLHFNPFSPSIDKINPFGFYEPNNVQYVCSWYNFAKGQFDEKFFVEMCKIVVKNNESK